MDYQQNQLQDDVKDAIDYIISNENYETSPEIEVTRGSEDGDGYASKTHAISIKGKNETHLQLFVKYLPKTISADFKNIFAPTFRGEFKFYNEIYPAFNNFQEKRNIENPFNNVPKCYGRNTSSCEAPPIILENLRSLGYSLRDRAKPFDEDHVKLSITTFARYHAISFAMKDQEPEEFKMLSTDLGDAIVKNFTIFKLNEMVDKAVHQLLNSLDPVSDKNILDHCKNLAEVLVDHTLNIPKNADEYAVICQGDCWSCNMMFLYDEKTGLPVNVKTFDWQCQRANSPLLDLAHFFITCATKPILEDADYYLNLYYGTLSERIRELGSDPEKMFPYEIFLTHWKKFSLFGLTMAFLVVKILLFEKDEVPTLIESEEAPVNSLTKELKHEDRYIDRMKDLIRYFIDKEIL